MKHRNCCRVLALAAHASISLSAAAAGTSWTFNGGGDWTVASNWFGGVPAATFDVFLSHSNSTNRVVNYDYAGPSIQFNSMTVQSTGIGSTVFSQSANFFNVSAEAVGSSIGSTGYWQLSGGVHQFSNFDFGLDGGSTGIGTITGGQLSGGNLRIGFTGSGSVSQSAGTVGASLMILGWQPTSSGRYSLIDGTLQCFSSVLGSFGQGTFNMSGGTFSVSNNAQIGTGPSGSFIQSGGVHTVTGVLFVGNAASGVGRCTLNGTASMTVSGSAYFGGNQSAASGSGILNVDGGTLRVTNTLKVWNSGTSALTLNGGTLSVGSIDVNQNLSRFAFNSGTLIFSGAGLDVFNNFNPLGSSIVVSANKSLIVNSVLQVGTDGFGGTVTQTGGQVRVGLLRVAANSFGVATGTYQLSGGTLDVLDNTEMVAGNGTALFNQSGGAHNVAGGVAIGSAGSSGTAVMNITGGTATIGSTLRIYDTGQPAPNGTRLNLSGGALSAGTIDASGNPARFAFSAGSLSLTGAGGLDISPTGLLGSAFTLNAARKLLSVAGTTTISGGATLVIDGGTFSTGSLAVNGVFQFNSGTFRLTASNLTVGPSGLLGSTLRLDPGQRIELTGLNTLNVQSGAMILLNGGSAVAAGGLINSGLIQLSSPTSVLDGGMLTNAGTIAGSGRIASNLSNVTGGVVRASASDWLQFGGVFNSNSGQFNLTGGEIDFAGPLVNDGVISGRGVLSSGGLTNNGQIQLSAGFSDVFGSLTNSSAAKTIVTGGSTSTFYNDVTNNGGSEFRVTTGATAVFLGNVTGAGQFTGGGVKIFEGGLSLGALSTPGGTIVESSGSVTVDHFRESFLTVLGNAKVLSNGGNAGASRVGTLTISGGTLDLSDNDLIVQQGTYAAISGDVRDARNGGAWDGPGLTSSAARTASPKNRTLGVLSGIDYRAVYGPSAQFNGDLVTNTDTLVKFTYYGDTDFSGTINFDDYARVDAGFNSGGTDWFHGDFDYNGVVNFDDYALIDFAFNTQSGTLRRALSWLGGDDRSDDGMSAPPLRIVQQNYLRFGDDYAAGFMSAVPEPAGAALVSVIGAMMLRRRRG